MLRNAKYLEDIFSNVVPRTNGQHEKYFVYGTCQKQKIN